MIRQKPISLKIDSGLLDRLDFMVAQRPGYNRNKVINHAVALLLDVAAFSRDYDNELSAKGREKILQHLARHVLSNTI